MKRSITVAAIQPNAESCASESHFYKKVFHLSHIAKQSGAKVIVFPEGLSMWLSWCKEAPRVEALYWGNARHRVVATMGVRSWIDQLTEWFFSVVKLNKMGEWMSQSKYKRIMKRTFAKVAKELDVVIVAGSLYTRTSNGFENISMVFDKDGSLVGEPGKTHLMPIEQSWGFSASKTIEPVTTSEGVIGVCVCYDLNFTDVVKTLKEKGAEFVCAPSGGWRPFPGYPFDIVKDMPQKERARESGLSIVRPYQCGWVEPGMYFDGRTNIVDGNGQVTHMSRSTSHEEVIVADIEVG